MFVSQDINSGDSCTCRGSSAYGEIDFFFCRRVRLCLALLVHVGAKVQVVASLHRGDWFTIKNQHSHIESCVRNELLKVKDGVGHS